MKTKFLVEAQSTSPRFSMKVETTKGLSKSIQISIFPSIAKDVVYNGVAHRDTVYNSKIARCQDLECSEFFTTARTTGQISQCGDCLPKRTRPPGDRPRGCTSGVSLHNFTIPDNIKVTNVDGGDQDYLFWLAGTTNQDDAALNQSIAKSGYWLGLTNSGGMCGPPIQCIVGCGSGSVAGCWNTEKSGGASFGDIYSINGSTYQVYDPIQIHLAGISSNGGSLPFLSTNPLQGLTPLSTAVPFTCGPVVTVVTSGGGTGPGSDGNNGSDDDVNVIITGSGSDDNCSGGGSSLAPGQGLYSPTPSLTAFPESFAIYGDITNKVICTTSDCYMPNQTDGLTLSTGKYRFGGSVSGVPIYNLNEWSNPDIGLVGSLGGLTVHDTPGEGLEYIIKQTYNRTKSSASSLTGSGSPSPSCCQFSSGALSINGAPNLDTSTNTWGSGSNIWNNFWSSPSIDDEYRDPIPAGTEPNIKGWRGCNDDQNTANSLYTTPCRPISKCGSGGGGGNYLLQVSFGANESECCGGIGYANSVPGCGEGENACGGNPSSFEVAQEPCGKVRYLNIGGIDENGNILCSSDDCGKSTTESSSCKLPCNVYLLGGQSTIEENVKDLSNLIATTVDGGCSSPTNYTIKTIFGCANKITITGKSEKCLFPSSCAPESITSTGYQTTATIRSWAAQGLTVGGGSAPDGQGFGSYSGGSCCSELFTSPGITGGSIDVPIVCEDNGTNVGEFWFTDYIENKCGC